MADQKISQLNNIAGANVAADDEFVIVDTDANETKAIRADNIRAAVGLATTDSPTFAGLTVDTNTLYVDAASNEVGIGTTSPSAKLDVVGNAEINGNATVTNNLTIGGNVTIANELSVNDTVSIIKDQDAAFVGLRIDNDSTGGSSATILQVQNGASSSLNFTVSEASQYVLLTSAGNAGNNMYVDADNHIFRTKAGTTKLVLQSDTKVDTPGVYTETTGSSANVFVDTDGSLRRSTSSLRYKINVEDMTYGLKDVMALRPVTYAPKPNGGNGPETKKRFGGLIAEEVHAAGLTEFVAYDDWGNPDALHYGHMISLAIKAIQEQQAQIEALEQRIAVLEGAA